MRLLQAPACLGCKPAYLLKFGGFALKSSADSKNTCLVLCGLDEEDKPCRSADQVQSEALLRLTELV